MKTRTAILLGCLLILGGNAVAQVDFADQDVPTTPGTTFQYFVASDAAVDVGSPGADQTWDFSQLGSYTVQNEEIVSPETSPFYDLFPTANRVTLGPVPFGLADVPTWRYDEVGPDQWTMLGIALSSDQLGQDFPFPLDVPLMPLPLNYNDTWGLDLYHEETISVSDIPYPIPMFDEIRLEITIQGGNTCDGWGTVALPGGVVDALRVATDISGHVNAVGIYYLFGLPIEVPLGEVYTLEASRAYSWYSPGRGEVAFALSYPGETDPNFTTAATVRVQNQGDILPTIVLDAEPLAAPIEIPASGGSFDWTLGITSTYQTPYLGVVWTTATLPDGSEYFIQSVPVELPAQADIFVPSLVQDVPAAAPAGDYTFNVYIGPDQTQPIAHDSFGFSKLAAASLAESPGSWRGEGLDQLAAEPAAASDEQVAALNGGALGPAYPNPFNPTTSLLLTLQEPTPVDIVVYDARGQRAAVLARGQFAAGRHVLTLDGSRLSSGVYFVSATIAGQGPQTQKVVLLK